MMDALTPDFVRRIRPAYVEVDGDALAHNLGQIRRRRGESVKVICTLKADACGNGTLGVARYLQALGVYALATGDACEAIALRKAGIDTRIVLFPCHCAGGIPTLIQYKLIPTVSSLDGATAVSSTMGSIDGGARYPLFIKVDCGLGRFGIPLADAAEEIFKIARLPNITIAGIYTHVPFFDEPTQAWARRQTDTFEILLGRLERAGIHIPITQAAASAAIMTGLADHLSAVAPGQLLFGLSPFDSPEAPTGFRPVMSALKSRLIHIATTEQVAVQDRIGRFYARGTMLDLSKVRRTGVFLLGVANGYSNPVEGSNAYVLIRGSRAPILGVTLEYTVVDLTSIPTACVEDEIVIIGQSGGEHLSLFDVVSYLGKKPLTFVAGLHAIPREYRPLTDASTSMHTTAGT